MGQKVHPYSLRLGINKGWKSRWYVNPKDYSKTLHEDIKVRRLILGLPEAKSADVSDVEITRHPQKVSIVIHTSHPGILIGSKGANIEKIGNVIHQKLGLRVSLKVKEIKRAESNAQCVALGIAKQLKGRSSFRRVLKMTVSIAMRAGAQGIKVKISGRLAGAEMARSVELKEGRVPLQTLRANIDYGFAEANTTYGIIGVKVWIFKGEVLRKEKEKKGEEAISLRKNPVNLDDSNKKQGTRISEGPIKVSKEVLKESPSSNKEDSADKKEVAKKIVNKSDKVRSITRKTTSRKVLAKEEGKNAESK